MVCANLTEGARVRKVTRRTNGTAETDALQDSSVLTTPTRLQVGGKNSPRGHLVGRGASFQAELCTSSLYHAE